jgi:hypothetical protein
MPRALVSAGIWKLRPGRRVTTPATSPRAAIALGRSSSAGSSRLAVGPPNVIPGEWTAVRGHDRLPSQCEHGGRSSCWARRREEASDLRAESPARSVSSPSAGSHCLNRLPVHRSIAVAGRRGQANGGEPAVRIGDKTEWPAFMVASRSRIGGRHLIWSRVIIKRHTGTLRAGAGYCPDVAMSACRPACEQSSGRLGQFQHAAKRLGRRRFRECRPGARDSIAGIRRGAFVS